MRLGSIGKRSKKKDWAEILGHYDFQNSTDPRLISPKALQNIRLGLLVCCILLQIANMILINIQQVVQYDGWGVSIAIFSLFFSYLAGMERYKERNNLIETAGILCEVSISYDLIVCLIYWSFIHYQKLDTYDEQMVKDPDTFNKFTLGVITHTLPLIASVTHLLITRLVFIRSHMTSLIQFWIIQVFFDYIQN